MRLYHFALALFIVRLGATVGFLALVLALAGWYVADLLELSAGPTFGWAIAAFAFIALANAILQLVLRLVFWIILQVKGRTLDAPDSPEGLPVAPTGVWVDENADLHPGDRVLACTRGGWQQAEIVRILPGKRVWLRFPGWDSFWDEPFRKRDLQAPIETDETDRSAPETSIRSGEP
jgi:hypothetical protein